MQRAVTNEAFNGSAAALQEEEGTPGTIFCCCCFLFLMKPRGLDMDGAAVSSPQADQTLRGRGAAE